MSKRHTLFTSKLEKALGVVAAQAVKQMGVPTTPAQAQKFAAALYPIMRRYRSEAYKLKVQDMGKQMAALGLEVSPAPEAYYPPKALYKLVLRAAGLDANPTHAVVEVLDAETQKAAQVSAIPAAMAENPDMQDEMARRVGASGARHVRAAARDAVVDTAEKGEVRHAGTGKKVAGEVRWARVLQGEACAFCAMLASRDPSYTSKEKALYKAKGGKYHDNCNCEVVLVVEGQPWPGMHEQEALHKIWKDATWKDGKPAKNQLQKWAQLVDTGRGPKESRTKLNPRTFSVDLSRVPKVDERGWAKPQLDYNLYAQVRRYEDLENTPRLPRKESAIAAAEAANPNGKLVTWLDEPEVYKHRRHYLVNCVRCTHTWELRRRGYDVTAGLGSYRSVDLSAGNSQIALAKGFKTKDGKEPDFWHIKAPAGKPRGRQQDLDLIRYMEQELPAGARGFVSVVWPLTAEEKRMKNPPPQIGHTLVWEKKKKYVYFYDPQVGDINLKPRSYIRRIDPGSMRAVRTDDLELKDDILDVVGGDLDQWRMN